MTEFIAKILYCALLPNYYTLLLLLFYYCDYCLLRVDIKTYKYIISMFLRYYMLYTRRFI
jgi:hypothetical protein